MSTENGKPARKRFKKVRKEEVVEVENDRGEVTEVTLRGLDGPDREDFISFMTTKARIDRDGNPAGLRDVKGMTMKLLAMSCFFTDTGDPVPEEEIKTWTGEMQGEMFDICQRLSGLTKAARDEAKNG